jgi:hypothetical protein
MTPALHVVLTCTKRKRHAAGPKHQLRSHDAMSLEGRFESWLSALQTGQDRDVVRVKDLYAGDHWQRGCALPAVAARHGTSVRLWVCSAGYGLIPVDSSVQPYSATFSRGHPDSVWRPGEDRSHPAAVREWWRLLGGWQGPTPGAPRSISDLAAQADGAGIWVVASPTYLAAMQLDLAAASQILVAPDRLVLISAGAKRMNGLGEHLLGFDWRLQGDGGPLDGAAMSLNVRVAELLLAGGYEHGVSALRARLSVVMASLPQRTPPARKRVSADDVAAFVREELSRDPDARATPLLRKLRDDLNWAFEEKRFRQIVADLRRSGGAESHM